MQANPDCHRPQMVKAGSIPVWGTIDTTVSI